MPSYIRTRTEFAVNSFTAANQMAPAVSTFADGGFVVVWGTADSTQDGSSSAIKAQLFDSAGNKLGMEFLVNDDASGGQFTASVAALDGGRFVVTWVTSSSEDGNDGIRARLFDPYGYPIGGEFGVNTTVTGGKFTPNVTRLADGGFVISWDDWSGFDTKAQIFDSAGLPVGGEFRLNSNADYAQGYGDIVGLAGGGFVATWRTTDSLADGSGEAVKAQVFSATGAKVGAELLVNSQKAGHQNSPSLAALAGGGFVITWHNADTAQDGSGSAIRAQLFNASGVKVGGEVPVNSQAADSQTEPAITATPDGGFVIAWTTWNSAQDGSSSAIKAQSFDQNGAKVGGELLVNTLAAAAQFGPDLATLADGRVIVTWQSESGDFDSYSLRAQILGTVLAPPQPNTRPIIISNGGGTSVTLSRDEGEMAITTVVASDDGEPNNLRYSISGGGDAALFRIDAFSGVLSWVQPPEFDPNGSNFYSVTVTASDGELTGFQSIQISVNHVNHVTIVSDGGWEWAQLWMDENQTAVTTVSAVDEDGAPLTYSISGGDDAYLFTIDAQTGALSFIAAPDYERPEDQYWDNVYEVLVTATDGTRSDTQFLGIFINDIEEAPGFAITSDGGGDGGQVVMPENGTAVTIVTAGGAAGPVTYAITGGYDSSLFTIDATTGALSFVDAPDFENPPYAGPGSHYSYYGGYQVVVGASDGTSLDEQELKIIVEDLDEAPEFYSYWGEAEVALTVAENDPLAGYVYAGDPDPYSWVTYGLVGADSALFQVDPYYGTLSFANPAGADFEAPADADGDNVYEVTVVAYSGALSATQSFSIRVEDAYEYEAVSFDSPARAFAVDEVEFALGAVSARGDLGAAIVYSIEGGADAASFTIDPVTGQLGWVAEPDYEGPQDQGGDNVYELVVSASDGTTSASQSVSVSVAEVDEPLEIVSYGGAGSVSLSLPEAGYWRIGFVEAEDDESGMFNPIVFTITGGADAALFDVNPYSGELRFDYDLAPDFENPSDADGDNVYEVVVTASSSTSSESQAFSVTLLNRNEGVWITSNTDSWPATATVAENSRAVTTVTAEDPDGTIPTFSIVGGADADRFTIDAQTGVLSFVDAPNYEGQTDYGRDNVYNVTVAASDGEEMDVQDLRVVVQDVDEAPVFSSYQGAAHEAQTLNENDLLIGYADARDPDPYSWVTYSLTGVDAALFQVDPYNGTFAFNPAGGADFETPRDADGDNIYEFTVVATSGALSSTQSFSFTIRDVNERPDIITNGGGTSASVSLNEGRMEVTTVIALDDGPNPVRYSITGGSAAGLFTINEHSGDLVFRTPPDYENPAEGSSNFYTVQVTADDGELSTFQTIQVTVNNVYEDVRFAEQAAFFTVAENGTAIGTTSAIADTGMTVQYSIAGGADAAHFTIDPATGGLSFVTPPNFEAGSDSNGDNLYMVIVSGSDGTSTGLQYVTVMVTDVAETVEFVSYGAAEHVALTMGENSLWIGMVIAQDSAGHAVTYSIVGGADAAVFEVDPSSGHLTFVYEDMPNFEAPGDADGDNVYDVVIAANSESASDLQSFAVTIVNRNEGVFVTSNGGGYWANIPVAENDRAVTTVTGFDPDGTVPTFLIVGGADASRFTIDAQTGVLSFIDAPDYEAPTDAGANNVYIVTVAASDGEQVTWQDIAVRVGDVDDTIEIVSYGGADIAIHDVAEGETAAAQLDAVTPNSGPVTYSITGGDDAALFAIDPVTGTLRFIAAPDFEFPGDVDGNNTYMVTVTAGDGVSSDTQIFGLGVVNVNEEVVITSNGGGAGASLEANENQRIVTTIVAEDIDGTFPSFAIVGGADAARFTIDAQSGLLQFVSAPNREAPGDANGDNVYDVVVRATDGSLFDDQALAVTVANVDEGVTITSYVGQDNISLATAENSTGVGQVAAVDVEGDPVTYSIAGGADAALFRVDPATGVLSFAAAPNFEAPADADGNNVYKVEVAAISGAYSDTQSFSVAVYNANEPLAITSNGGGATASVSVGENSRTVTTVATADPDGPAAHYSIVGGADASRFTINAQTGLLEFVTAPDHETPGDANGDNVYDVVVRAGDGQFADYQTLSVGVLNLRDGNNVTGTTGGDSISGTSTNPALRTSNAEDNVAGRDGHDTILGLAGDDILGGDAGNDVLNGGAGADRLTGGLGKDQFVYNAASESTPGARDVITDFSRAQNDKISLSGIDANSVLSGNQTFTFIGAAAFSNVAGQLRYSTSGGATFVSGDVNGDGVADFQIELTGTLAPVASDFVL